MYIRKPRKVRLDLQTANVKLHRPEGVRGHIDCSYVVAQIKDFFNLYKFY
jgi:hypothetical protein